MPATAVRREIAPSSPAASGIVPSRLPHTHQTGGLQEGCLSFPELLAGANIGDPKTAPKETESAGEASRTFHQESLGRGVTITYEGGLWSIECATQGGLRGLWNRGLKVFSKKNTGSFHFQLGENIDDAQYSGYSFRSKKERVEYPAGWTYIPTTTKRAQEMADTQEQEARSFLVALFVNEIPERVFPLNVPSGPGANTVQR